MTSSGQPSLEAAQRALAESEERHRSLFEHAVEGIVAMGEDRLIQSMNPAAQKLFGYTEEEVVGQNVKMLMPSPYHEEHDSYVKNYVKTGEKKIIGIGREVVGRHKNGTTFPLELSVAELQLTHERVFTGILRDISDRKQAEEELHRINEHLEDLVRARTQALAEAQEALVRKERLATLGQLAGSVAHEVRNPLGVVRNAAFYLEQKSDGRDPEAVESFAEIRRGLARANHIITELLEYARDPQTHHRAFVLTDAVESAFEGVEIPADVTVNREVDPLECRGDPDQISQILRNLIVNAFQAMPKGGALSVGVRRDEGKAVIEVRDSGSGIDEEQLGKIFEPLFTTKTRGIGLGLALSLRYAELNHATLAAESVLGEGSVFRLTLPIRSKDS